MSKRVEITEEIKRQIQNAVGDDTLDTSRLVVFEARALTTEPIQRKAGFFKNARMTPATIREMASLLNRPNGAIPMQIMHDTEVLPVGRVFRASIYPMDNGELELRTLFYIPADKTDIVQDIENSVIDEVSVGLMNEHAYCSECDFDYFGPEADFMNRITLTCSEGHVIGEDGTHVRLVGISDWAELSLVNRGAAKGAKILSRAKQDMSQSTVERLAASNIPFEQRLFAASYKMEDNVKLKGDPKMDKEFLATFEAKVTEGVELKAKLAQTTTENEALKAQLTQLTASLEAANDKITQFEQDPAKAELQTQLAAALETETKMSEAVVELTPHVKAALVASGEVETTLPSEFSAMLKLCKDKGLMLHQVFGVEPKADATKTDSITASAESDAYRQEAFKTKPRTK